MNVLIKTLSSFISIVVQNTAKFNKANKSQGTNVIRRKMLIDYNIDTNINQKSICVVFTTKMC